MLCIPRYPVTKAPQALNQHCHILRARSLSCRSRYRKNSKQVDIRERCNPTLERAQHISHVVFLLLSYENLSGVKFGLDGNAFLKMFNDEYRISVKKRINTRGIYYMDKEKQERCERFYYSLPNPKRLVICF